MEEKGIDLLGKINQFKKDNGLSDKDFMILISEGFKDYPIDEQVDELNNFLELIGVEEHLEVVTKDWFDFDNVNDPIDVQVDKLNDLLKLIGVEEHLEVVTKDWIDYTNSLIEQ